MIGWVLRFPPVKWTLIILLVCGSFAIGAIGLLFGGWKDCSTKRGRDVQG